MLKSATAGYIANCRPETMDFIPILLFWAIALCGLVSRRPVLLWLLVLSIPFGSFAVLPPGLTGGLTFIPTAMTAMLICIRQFLLHRWGMNALADVISRADRGLLLFCYWLVSLVVTIFMPRIMAGQIEIVPMRGVGLFMETAWLRPTTQNISQLAYLTISVFSVFALFQMLRQPGMMQTFVRAWMAGAAMVIFTGLLDLATRYVPINPLLEPLRTATYALLSEDELRDGTKRVVGLMPEASSYGNVCMVFLGLLYFLRNSLDEARQRRRAGWLCAGLALFAVLSTSSASYVALGVLGAMAVLEWLWRAGVPGRTAVERRGVPREFLIALSALVLFCLLLILRPALFDPIVERIQIMVFNKVDTDSFRERSMWTRTSLQAVYDTWLIGVGLGSTRASNEFVALFAASGLAGVLLYYGFVLRQLLRPVPATMAPLDQALVRAVRWSFLPGFAVSLLIGTSSDFGIPGALRWALVLAAFGASVAPANVSASLPVPGAGQRKMLS